MPKVSIIMPSLNVAPYIQEAVDSVVCQTLSDIEIICVDAGSTDGTWEILERYAVADNRIKLFRSEKKSYGYQMNLGIREASGEYIGIVETDDYILPEMYEELYTYAVEHDADFVKSDFDIFTTRSDGKRLFLYSSLHMAYDTLFTWQDYANSNKLVDTFIWNGIYKKDFLQDNQIGFQETPGAAYQDVGFRYQVALSVKRGFFLNRSFYRYRRDNAGSSMYNSKCVLYNWSECQYIMKIMKERGWTSKAQMRLLARDMAQTAYGPYINMLQWAVPAEGTKEALAGFRALVKDFIAQELLVPSSVSEDIWLIIKLFVENSDCFEYYARLRAAAIEDVPRYFFKNIAQKEKIVLFGSGIIGTAAYCTIQNVGIETVAAFCDNDSRKWETKYMSLPVLSPEEAVKQYPKAYYIIANRAHQDEIKKQLLTLHVPEEHITVYNLNIDPMFCMNMALRTLLQ